MHRKVAQQRKSIFGALCPHCQEPILDNHLYCRSCGASQFMPEFDRAFCPFCGLRVSKKQEFCHECCGYLIVEEVPVQYPERPAFFQHCCYKFRGWVNRYIQASLIVGGLVFALITYLAITKTAIFAIPFAQNKEETSIQGVQVAQKTRPSQALIQTPSASLPSLGEGLPIKTQLTQMLNQIREAQMNKDINLFMNSFSTSFHKLDEKRHKILSTWQSLDFIEMTFEIKDIHKQDNNNASIKVDWKVEAKKPNNNKIEKFSKSYSLSLVRERDKWLIKDVI